MKIKLAKLLCIICLVVGTPSVLAQAERYVAGTHYVELENSVRTANPAKIEVVEIFWYGCPHCFRLEPLLRSWTANMADDVDFVLFPGFFNSLMKIHAQIYFTAHALDVVDKMHTPIFEALIVERKKLRTPSQISSFFEEYGVSPDRFDAAFNSFSVRTQLNQTESRMAKYQPKSTPNMVINGKYLVSNGDHHEMLKIVDFLIEKERGLRARLRQGSTSSE